MTIQTLNIARLRLPAWVLTLQPLVWAATVYIALTALFTAGNFLYWTPAIMAEHRVPWLAFTTLELVGFLGGFVPAMLILRDLAATRARILAWAALICTAIGLGLMLTYLALRFSVVNFTEPTLGDTFAFRMAIGPVGILADISTLLGIAALGLCLWQTHLARRTGMVVAVVSILLIPLGLNKPPFIYSLLWLPLGIALLRARLSPDPSPERMDAAPTMM